MIQLEDVAVGVGSFALQQVNLTIPSGAYGVLMGRTGCGKTTILETVAGLIPVQAGRVRICGDDVTDLEPSLRGVGYVPQDAALFKTMTVAEHLSFALDIRHVPRPERRDRVAELAELLGIEPLLARRPEGLSGGERQRVALGRALSFRPRVLLLDEPLSAIDEDTREDMYRLLLSARDHADATVLHITHSRAEADRLADTILRLESGGVRRVADEEAGLPGEN